MERMKRAISMLLALVMIFSACPANVVTITASAAENGTNSYAEYDGRQTATLLESVVAESTELDFTYKVLNGTFCQVTGYTGTETEIRIPSEIDGYIVQSIAESAFRGKTALTGVVFPETVETIGAYLFYGCTALKDVRLNTGLTGIGNYTFYGCTALESITLPSAVESLGSYAFGGCTRLTEVSLPEGLTTIGRNAFEGCTALVSITLPDSVTTIGYEAFYNCSNLSSINYPAAWTTASSYRGSSYTGPGYQGRIFAGCSSLKKIEIPEGVTKIPSCAFSSCTYLEEVVLPSTLTTIGTYAFHGCSRLTAVTPNEGLTTIGSYAFENCTGLKTITLPESLTTLNSYAFSGCTGLTEIEIPGSVTTVSGYAFYGCSGLKKAVVKDGTTTVGEYAFRNCTGLTDVSLPEGLTTLERNAFEGCTALVSIVLPDSVTSIGYEAFYNCSKLSSINYPAGWTVTPSYRGASYTGPGYQGRIFAGCSSLKKIEIPEGVTSIPSCAFSDCTYLEEVVFPSTLTTVGTYAFRNCSRLATVATNEGLTTIGSYAFENCTGLKTITLPESLTALNSYAFSGCTGLTAIEIPGGVATVSGYAFNGCSGLKKAVMKEGTTTVGEYAFRNCSGLTDVTLPEGLTTLERSAFEGCTALVSIVLPDSVTSIGYEAFFNCSRLRNVNYPAGWTVAPSYRGASYTGPGYQGRIFAGCSSLKKIEIPEGVTKIPSCAFSSCTYLEEVVLPGTLTAIGTYAFYDCTALTTVILPEGLTTIPASCFYNCTSLAEAVIPSTVKTIENNAYYNCASLAELVIPSNVEAIGDYAYCNCIGLRTITMEEGIKSIGSHAFYGCDGVLSVVLSEGLEKISDYAFSNCNNLKAVELPSSVTSIGGNVFDGNAKLTIYCYSGSKAHMVSESEGYSIYLLDEHDHDYTTTVETSPTCTRGGSQILTCSICAYYFVDILEALGHDYADTVVAPTCEEEGYTLHECSRCDDAYQDAIVSATGHDYGEWETITDATCTEDGSQKRVCKVCQEEEVQPITAPGHDYEEVVIPPTCTAEGCTLHTCTVCHDVYADSFVDALEHSFGDWAVTKEPTILAYGVRARSCRVCSKEETAQIERITIDLENNTQYGVVNFTVCDALSLEPVSGASIFITTDNDGEATIITDRNGKVSQVLPVGQWPVAVYADGYLVRNITVTVEAGEQDLPAIGISDKPLVDATITTTEMTYEEMLAAGIDVNHSDNKHYFKYEVKIIFHEELDIMSFISYGDGEGNIISTVPKSNTTRTVYALSHDEDAVDAEAVTIVYSEKYGTYILDRTSYENAVWTPTFDDGISFTNNGYYFEGYGIPSTLTMTTNRAFPDDGWTFDAPSGRLSMSVGERTHYLTFRDGAFCTVSNSEDSIPINLFEKIPAKDYPTEVEYVYVPAETFEAGKQYLLVQFEDVSSDNREALSHKADQPDHETVTIYGDDVYGQYIVDSDLYENAVWMSSAAQTEGLKIVNNYYYAQVDGKILKCMPLANEPGWVLNGEFLTTTIGEEIYYLRYNNGTYSVTDNKSYAGTVMVFEKSTATDVISGDGRTVTKIIYRRVDTFEEGKEYIIIGSGRSPGGGGGGSGGGGGGGFSGGSGGGFSGALGDGTPFTVYPVSEKFYLIIYGEVSWLKEMFDVEMLILNNSSTDTIENCVAELILPDGLSLAAMVDGEQSTVQTVDHIPENGSHSLHWYVRGDKQGSYNITATLAGTMMPFNEDFYYEYEADSPIKVYAGSAMKMTIHIPEVAYNEVKYVVKFELENVSDKVLYGVTHMITGWEQGKIIYHTDGREPEEIPYGSGGPVGVAGVDAFYPGDKIVLEVGFDILFESSIRKRLMETANQVEELYEAYQAVKTAYDLLSGLSGFCSSASSALNGIINAGTITSAEKLKAAGSLLSAINELYGVFESGDSEAIELANQIQSSELYELIKSCADATGCEAFLAAETAENILELANKIASSVGGKEPAEKPYNAFDSLRTMISNIPIRYVVDQVIVSTMNGSTTTIPHEVVLTPVGSPPMVVDNWGKYIYSWTITAMGKISAPWYAQLFGAPDDVTGYDDAVSYVKQVENQIAAYSVHKSSGTTFRAWVERAPTARAVMRAYSAGTTGSDFLIETDNETAVYEDGVLTFTGNALLEVTALSTADGILYIEDDEGNVKTIVIDTVQAHTCHSDNWIVEIAPTEDLDGYRAKCCDICGDTIAIENLTACGEHIFGDWTVEQEATGTTMGIQYQECETCFAKEIEYLPIIKGLGEHLYIRGPVDVEVRDADGDAVFTLKDGEAGSYSTDYGYFSAAREEDGNYGKVLDLIEGNTVRIAGAGDGTMDVVYQKFVDGELTVPLGATEVPVSDTWTATIEENDDGSVYLVVDEDDDGNADARVLMEHIHSWDEGVITQEANCTESGERLHTCTSCGDTKTEEIEAWGHSYEEGICGTCGTVDPGVATESDATRLSGKGRCETAYLAADELKAALGVEKFDAVIIASGDNFADALAGSYLAAVKGAPILLYRNGYADDNATYIAENMAADGTVYILGGTAAVPEEMETALAGYTVKRVKGANRFETNLAILEEAGVGQKDILVATGYNFADSLSASATGMPILLVHNGGTDLTETQKAFLDELDGNNIVVIGGTGAVNDNLYNALDVYGDIERIKGSGREATSVAIAEKYFDAPTAVVLAYSRNFPDGLCGGPLAYALGAPLLLTNKGYDDITAAYTTANQIADGFVLGGTAAVSDEIVRTVFAMEADAEITVKR